MLITINPVINIEFHKNVFEPDVSNQTVAPLVATTDNSVFVAFNVRVLTKVTADNWETLCRDLPFKYKFICMKYMFSIMTKYQLKHNVKTNQWSLNHMYTEYHHHSTTQHWLHLTLLNLSQFVLSLFVKNRTHLNTPKIIIETQDLLYYQYIFM